MLPTFSRQAIIVISSGCIGSLTAKFENQLKYYVWIMNSINQLAINRCVNYPPVCFPSSHQGGFLSALIIFFQVTEIELIQGLVIKPEFTFLIDYLYNSVIIFTESAIYMEKLELLFIIEFLLVLFAQWNISQYGIQHKTL